MMGSDDFNILCEIVDNDVVYSGGFGLRRRIEQGNILPSTPISSNTLRPGHRGRNKVESRRKTTQRGSVIFRLPRLTTDPLSRTPNDVAQHSSTVHTETRGTSELSR